MKRIYVFIIALFLMAGLAACGGNDTAPTATTDTPAPTATPAPEPTPTPEQTPTPQPAEEPEDDNGGNAALFQGANWSMEIAHGWNVMEIAGMSFLISPGGSGSNVNVVVESMQGLSLDDYVEATLATLEIFYTGLELYLADYLTVNGKDAVLIVYDADALDVYLMYQFIIEYSGTAFIVTYTRMDETDYSYDVMDMLATFTVRGAIAAATPTASQIIGEWHMISSGEPVSAWGLENGWGYDKYFFADGTGIEWWNSPDTGWHEVTNFTWSASGGQITITIIGIDFDVIDHYLGEEVGDLMEYAIGVPMAGTYNVTGNTLTLVIEGVSYVYQRN